MSIVFLTQVDHIRRSRIFIAAFRLSRVLKTLIKQFFLTQVNLKNFTTFFSLFIFDLLKQILIAIIVLYLTGKINK